LATGKHFSGTAAIFFGVGSIADGARRRTYKRVSKQSPFENFWWAKAALLARVSFAFKSREDPILLDNSHKSKARGLVAQDWQWDGCRVTRQFNLLYG
jgi:hypothetical protein